MVNYGIKVKGIKKTFQSPSIYLSSCARTLCLPLQIYCLLSLPRSESQEADFLNSFTRPLVLVDSSN